jgi:ribosomal protein S27E
MDSGWDHLRRTIKNIYSQEDKKLGNIKCPHSDCRHEWNYFGQAYFIFCPSCSRVIVNPYYTSGERWQTDEERAHYRVISHQPRIKIHQPLTYQHPFDTSDPSPKRVYHPGSGSICDSCIQYECNHKSDGMRRCVNYIGKIKSNRYISSNNKSLKTIMKGFLYRVYYTIFED